MNKPTFFNLFLLLLLLCTPQAWGQLSPKDNTTFQTSGFFRPEVDIRADRVMVYGIHRLPERIQSWKEQGYHIDFMIGISWGVSNDYLDGKIDGVNHWDQAQIRQNGDTIWHGTTRGVPYIIPNDAFIAYMKEYVIKKVIDEGVEYIFLEEPEIWMFAGYSEAFKREWEKYYGFPWRPQHESPENTYLSHKLKYHLNYKAIEECFTYAKDYAKSIGREVKCYVATHSLVNYTAWQLVSPEASLASLDCVDGYIGQVWTGTARTANYYNGMSKERVFENAYLEYDCTESMTAPTGRRVYFLTDPIEDAVRDWDDYKRNYQATFAAKLFFPRNNYYEVMPWPDRIYLSKYPNPATGKSENISPAYATQMQVMINTLNDMPVTDNKISGSGGIGILMSNSGMFQFSPSHKGYSDPGLSNLYGFYNPLFKRGIPVRTVHIENLYHPNTLKDIQVLLMSYAGMKPMQEEQHTYLAEWVKKGGVLIYCARDNDPFQSVMEWWNTNGKNYSAPSEHLFELIGIDPDQALIGAKAGKGKVYVVRQDPKEFVLQANNDQELLRLVEQAYQKDAKAGKLKYKNYYTLSRGYYDLIAVMEESVSDDSYTAKGLYVDLFDPTLPICKTKTVRPGEQAFLLNLKKISRKEAPRVLCGAARVYQAQTNDGKFTFLTRSPSKTRNAMRVLLKKEPVKITATHQGEPIKVTYSWDNTSKTCLLQYDNYSDGVTVTIE